MTFLEILEKTLLQDERFIAEDGKVLKAKVYDAAMAMDEDLLHLLLSEQVLKDHFFKKVNDTFIFDKVEFTWVLNSREFLPDSYTMYKNKIGLVDSSGDLISQKQDVTLVWPYKDCVLEGGQTKDDEKRDEVFYNETLAPDQVTRLLYPKALANAKRYSYAGDYDLTGKAVGGEGTVTCEETTDFLDDDNLIIKGNNLLALSSLLRRYEGKVKLIYIDVPYNTGNDSFGYNDRFNQSTWLTFMKNRLQLAHRLLKQEGTIAISVDNYEIGYLLVLLDEVFGRENRKNVITVKRGSVTGAKVINPGVVNVVEYVILYSKDTSVWRPNRVYSAKGYDKRYNIWIENRDKPFNQWEFTTVLEKWSSVLGIKKSKLKSHFGHLYDDELNEFVIDNAKSVGQWATLDDNSIGVQARNLKAKSIEDPENIYYLKREDANDYYIRNGKLLLFAADRLRKIDGMLTFSQPVSDIWEEVLPNDLHNEGGVEFKKGKKPEKLLGRIIELCTAPNDLVLDFFAGSGTTGSAAMKLGRKFVLCEQMDYIQNVTSSRLQAVLSGETRGISSDTDWSGGGSFVYCELAERSETLMEQLQSAKDSKSILAILDEATEKGLLRPSVLPDDLKKTREEFLEFSLDEQRRLVMELLDKNKLYVNLCDMEDENMSLSESSKAFTRSFYNLDKDTEV